MKWYYKIYAISVIVASVFVITHMLILASMNNWLIILDFNSIGEGPIELIFAICGIPFIIRLLIEDIRRMKGEIDERKNM